MPKRQPTPVYELTRQQLDRFHARVLRDLAYYRGCQARIEDHNELHVTIDRLIGRLEKLDAYLSRPTRQFTAEQIAMIGEAPTAEWTVSRDRGGRRLRGVNDPAKGGGEGPLLLRQGDVHVEGD